MELLQRIAEWANRNDGLLQAIGMLAVASGVLLSPVGRWLRGRVHARFETAESREEPAEVEAGGGADRASIAVLPFAAASTDPEHEYLVDGLAEDLVTLLARIPGFFVIARQSTMAYRGHAVDVRKVGRDLDVRYVLQGSIRKLGDRVRLSAELAETANGTNLWTGQFDRKAEELDRIQDELTTAVAAQLEPELVRAEADLARRRPPADWDAWSYYQRAQSRLMVGGFNEDTFAEATALLRKAIALGPDFGLARAQLALLLAFAHRVGLDIDREAARAEALAEAEKSLALEGDRSEVLGYAGCAFADAGQPARGLPILERAVEANPSNAQAWVALGAGRLSVGEVEGAVAALRHGILISPQDSRLAMWISFYAAALAQLGRLEEALEQTRIAARRDPRAHMPRVMQALVLALLHREEEAATSLAAAREIRPNLTYQELEILLEPFARPLRPVWEQVTSSRSPNESDARS